MRDWIIEKLGGYPDIDSAIEAVREADSEEKYAILTLAVKRLFNTIGPEDIFKIHESGKWMYRGRPLREEEVKLLKSEAMQFQASKLWEMLQLELKYQANRKMYVSSENELDIVAGKLWVYTTDAISSRLKSMLK